MKRENILLLAVAVLLAAGIIVDRTYVSGFRKTFTELEQERIELSNKLATAKIVSENLNHVRDLVFKNMVFGNDRDIPAHESVFYDFITTCVNDLKMELVSVKPVLPAAEGNITTIAYDIELQGDFFSFGELCAKFENSRRIISVDRFKVAQHIPAVGEPEHKNGFRNVDITMRVNTYRIQKG